MLLAKLWNGLVPNNIRDLFERHCCGDEEPARNVLVFPPRRGTFEGLDIYLPNKIEVILERFYGDYMTPPPDVDKIHHFFLDFKLTDFQNGEIS